jgi:serine protease AprX
MSTPILAGCVAVVVDAYQQHHDEPADPVDVMNTIQATARNYHPVDSDVSDKRGAPYTVVNVGPGFVDLEAACARAEAGDWADFREANRNLIDAETI